MAATSILPDVKMRKCRCVMAKWLPISLIVEGPSASGVSIPRYFGILIIEKTLEIYFLPFYAFAYAYLRPFYEKKYQGL